MTADDVRGELAAVTLPGAPGTAWPGFRAAPRRFRVQADSYGCHIEVVVEHAHNATPQELDRALTLAVAQAKQAHAERDDPC